MAYVSVATLTSQEGGQIGARDRDERHAPYLSIERWQPMRMCELVRELGIVDPAEVAAIADREGRDLEIIRHDARAHRVALDRDGEWLARQLAIERADRAARRVSTRDRIANWITGRWGSVTDERIGGGFCVGDHVARATGPGQGRARCEDPPARIDRAELGNLAQLAMELCCEVHPAPRCVESHTRTIE